MKTMMTLRSLMTLATAAFLLTAHAARGQDAEAEMDSDQEAAGAPAAILRAPEVRLENVTVSPRDNKTALVTFDITWANAYRYGSFHDATWVFFQVRTSESGDWRPLRLAADKVVNPNVAARKVTAVVELNTEHRTPNTSVRAFGIEMCYVGEGPYFLGTGGKEANAFHAYVDDESGAAVAAWAGLRPLTELEYEKAVRGGEHPEPNEVGFSYWGLGFVNLGGRVEQPITACLPAGRTFAGSHGQGEPVLPADWPKDASARLYLGWDGEAVCLGAEVTDAQHQNTQSGGNLWNGDAMQLGVATPDGAHWNLMLALSTNGVMLYQAMGPGDAILKTADCAVTRDEKGKLTRYTLRLPLAALGLKAGDEFGFNAMICDSDTDNRMDFYLRLAQGINFPFRTELYPRFVLKE